MSAVNPSIRMKSLVSTAVAAAFFSVAQAADQTLWNAWEVHRDLHVDPSLAAAVKDYFPSFLEYQDLMLFHPKVGYYSSGRVSFVKDYHTFPSMLAPYFGQMIAAQAMRMWDGMRQAGTLKPGETFTLAEFGAGDGSMAESILDYMDRQARESADPRWREFQDQSVYACYDRSSALSAEQATRNARFGKRFEARSGDATDLTATIAPGSLKGLIVSNELPDAFSVHKVIISADGSAEVAFVAPWLSTSTWAKFEKVLPEASRELILRDAAEIRKRIFEGGTPEAGAVYLSRNSFEELLVDLASAPDTTAKGSAAKDYAGRVHAIQFHELYVPLGIFPELAAHFRQYAHDYATELAHGELGVVAYVNLGEAKFVQGAARILSAGYVLTVDYGSGWDGITPLGEYDHLRIYGPKTGQHSDPYEWPTLNDITTDVNFSHMAAEGQALGLKTVFFGPQHALASNTGISMETVPANRPKKAFRNWASDFKDDSVFKLLVQQKENTDPAYAYPDERRQRIEPDASRLTEKQRLRAAELEAALSRIR
jgi:SAM-dependent MidA family methyltransferase